jgi:hypothetical protein
MAPAAASRARDERPAPRLLAKNRLSSLAYSTTALPCKWRLPYKLQLLQLLQLLRLLLLLLLFLLLLLRVLTDLVLRLRAAAAGTGIGRGDR